MAAFRYPVTPDRTFAEAMADIRETIAHIRGLRDAGAYEPPPPPPPPPKPVLRLAAVNGERVDG